MFDVANFPILVKLNDQGVERNLVRGIAGLNKTIEDGGAIKVRAKEIKEDLNRAIEAAWETIVSKHIRWIDRNEYTYKGVRMTDAEVKLSLSYFHPSCHTIPGFLKKTAKLDTPAIRDARALFAEVLPLAEAVNDLKNKVLTKEPKIDPVLAYRAPPASQVAQKAVYDLLVKITESNFETLVAYYKARSIESVEAFQAKQAAAEKAGEKIPSINEYTRREEKYGRCTVDAPLLFLLESVFDRKDAYEHKVLVPLSTMDKTLDKAARVSADYQRKVFIYKNMNKMDSILEAKGGFSEAKLLGQSFDLLEASIRIVFKNGDAFTARTAIVWVYEGFSVPFTRYPLTFHDIKMGGKTKAMFSEKQMNEIFAVA